MAYAECDGVIVTDGAGVASCQDGLGAPLTWVAVEPFTIDQIEPETAGGFFAAGFVMYGTVWLLGRAVKVILDVVRR